MVTVTGEPVFDCVAKYSPIYGVSHISASAAIAIRIIFFISNVLSDKS